MLPSYVPRLPFAYDDETTTTHSGGATPPETVATDDGTISDLDPLDKPTAAAAAALPLCSTSSVPWPGETFILRCATSGSVLTLLDGRVVLQPPGGGKGSVHWACVESKGWLGFRSPVSGKFLGHDARGKLVCNVGRQQHWEYFAPRLRPDGLGFVLMMLHWERLWHVGVKTEGGEECLAKLADGADDGIVWEFVKV